MISKLKYHLVVFDTHFSVNSLPLHTPEWVSKYASSPKWSRITFFEMYLAFSWSHLILFHIQLYLRMLVTISIKWREKLHACYERTFSQFFIHSTALHINSISPFPYTLTATSYFIRINNSKKIRNQISHPNHLQCFFIIISPFSSAYQLIFSSVF